MHKQNRLRLSFHFIILVRIRKHQTTNKYLLDHLESFLEHLESFIECLGSS